MILRPPRSTLFPYRRSSDLRVGSTREGLREKWIVARRARVTQRCPWKSSSAATQGSDRKSTRLNSSHLGISYAVFCLKKKKKTSIVHHANQNNTNSHNTTTH